MISKNVECQEIIKHLQVYIKKHHGNEKEVKLLLEFAERYCSSASIEDLKERTIGEIYAILVSHWNFIQDRKPGEAKIRIFNPEKAKDGWHSTHTVIQISHDDIPFLVDSARMVINRYGYQIHFILHFGGFKVKRNKAHRISAIIPSNVIEKESTTEAPIYIEIDRLADDQTKEEIKADIERVLGDVRVAVADWRKMVNRVEECLNELENDPPPLDQSEIAESRDFLRWLVNNNFTFIGARDFKLIGDGTNRALQIVPGSGLGVLRDETYSAASKSYSELPPQARKMALSHNILIIAKTNTTSTVHRSAYTDYVGVKRFNKAGELIGERRFIGLYTSTAYNSSPRHIPFLRHKVDKVLQGLGYPPDSHDGKEAVHILETLPRDDLFQATNEELLELTLGIIQLKERKRVRLLVRRDAYYRYFSCLVYVPREIFNTELAHAMQDILMESFKGLESTFTTYFSDSILARIHFLVRVNPKVPVSYDVSKIENKLIEIAQSWSDELKNELIKTYAESGGLHYFYKYSRAFPTSYTEFYNPKDAISDIEKIEKLSDEVSLSMRFDLHGEDALSLKLFHADETIVLSDVLPILENMGLRIIGERPHEIKLKGGRKIWINDFDMEYVIKKNFHIHDIQDNFQEAFTKVWFNEAENDGFNRLVLEANLTWQETAMLRAYTKYLKQTGFTFSQSYIEEALIHNSEITKALVQLFILRFDPSYQIGGHKDTKELIHYIEQALDMVTSLDEDRILRRILEVMLATIRTNYFLKDAKGNPKSYISFKFEPNQISDLPLPRPKYEIFVYSPQMEGIHLRAGKVARGGLRWSDRREDFRTEVLGLMKAQNVKNTVIVPEGAKGGFVVKFTQLKDGSRDEYMKQVVNCYKTFICGMLDITDNIVNNEVIPPESVECYDDFDPYLVVAADKGTATFSDIANDVANAYHFWLGDAFASGGSAGYDHKKMGITSRGVWVSVKRHFREIGLDPEKDNFTVIGIGDMSGDVFGNGMLLSRQTKVIAAFNHMHIFLDPDPDPAVSYEERMRLFKLARSSWSDYNVELISKGGGVFSRTLKSIKLTPEIKYILNTKKETMFPNELIKAILKAPVDLIWNGGIGTFIKSSVETHLDVGDRTNDGIRIDATEVNARVIAEGGNLGVTQLGRIEYSLQGGIVNTDFIDNSAGVDCSDHEVNIKIVLNQLLSQDKLTLKDRNKLLEKMTDEVTDLVLLDNYDQTQMLSLETSVAHQTMDLFRHYMNELEKVHRIDRKLEYLPEDRVLIDRKTNNKPLTRPEIAILLAYSKMYLKQDILKTDVLDNPYFDKYLFTAFPKLLREKYPEELKAHSLSREIIATQLGKHITDRMGINFVERLQRETGASVAFIIKSFAIAETIFHMEDIWTEVTKLDYQTSTTIQYRMMLQIYYLIRRATRWFLRNRKSSLEIVKTIETFAEPILQLSQNLQDLIEGPNKEAFNAAIMYLKEHNIPESLAIQIATCNMLFTSLDIVEASHRYKLDLNEVAMVYYHLGNRLELNWLRELMNSYVVENQWDELARAGFRDDLDRLQCRLSASVLMMKVTEEEADSTVSEKVERWINRYDFLVHRWEKLLAEIKQSDTVQFITYSVVLRELIDFAQAA